MCGRYQRRADKQRIAEAFALGNVEGLAMDLDLAPNYNVAPGTMQPVIISDPDFGVRTLRMMFWRYLPPFCTDLKNFKLNTINAASHSLLKGMWKESFLKRRCLVPADSFVEWQTTGGRKLPWVFAMKANEVFALGGVWRRWRSSDGKREMDTFAIITVEPNELVFETIHHDRMPLIIEKSDWRQWLEPGTAKQVLLDLLRPLDSESMKTWRAGTAINSARNTGAELGTPLNDETDQQLGMF